VIQLRILFIGDIVGRPGRECVGRVLPSLQTEHSLDLVVANGENAAGGVGLTPMTADEIFATGVDVITLGNHTWAHSEIIPYFDTDVAVVRPLNYPPGAPGRGAISVRTKSGVRVVVINLLGRLFMEALDCPFRGADAALAELTPGGVVIVDMHAEATSEKQALGYYLDGRVSAVCGTHTHTPTADARVLPAGTLYVSDVGMVGPQNSVIGMDSASAIRRFMTKPAARGVKVDKLTGPVQFNSVLLTVDATTGQGVGIERLDTIQAE